MSFGSVVPSSDVAFTPTVKAIQERKGSRASYSQMEGDGGWTTSVTPDLAAVILCPSNPYLSVDPILSVDGMREALAARKVPFVAVSPLVGGMALKGPLTKLLGELGQTCDNRVIAARGLCLLDHLLIDRCDAQDAEGLRDAGVSVTITGTVMCTAEDRKGLAREALSAAGMKTG